MFVTLGVLPPPKTFRRRILRRTAKDTLSCSRVTLPNDFSFYHIQLTHDPDLPLPWTRIAETAGAFRTRLLLPDGLAIDDTADAAAFVPQKLPLRLLCNSAARTLQRMQREPLQQRLCVLDPQGVLSDVLDPFVPLVSELRVVTDDLLAYGETADRFRRKYGLSTFAGIVFTNHPQPRMNAAMYMPAPPVLPPDYAALCPPAIDPLIFASAAYELCAADTLGELWMPMNELSAVNSL